MLTTLGTFAGGAFVWRKIRPEPADPRMYLDSIYTGFKLAELNFVFPGTRLHFYKHRIGFDYPGQDVLRISNEKVYGGTTLEFLYTLTPALYRLAMVLRPTQEDSTTRLFFLLIWRGCYRLKNSYEAAGDQASAAHIQSVPIRIVEAVLKGKEIKRETYAIKDYSGDPLYLRSCSHWCGDSRRFAVVHQALLEALEYQMRGESAELVSSKLVKAKKDLRDFVSTFNEPVYPESYASPVHSELYPSFQEPIQSEPHPSCLRPFTAMEFNQQMTTEMMATLYQRFWPWFEQEYAQDEILNEGKWLTSIKITPSLEWLGVTGHVFVPVADLSTHTSVPPPVQESHLPVQENHMQLHDLPHGYPISSSPFSQPSSSYSSPSPYPSSSSSYYPSIPSTALYPAFHGGPPSAPSSGPPRWP